MSRVTGATVWVGTATRKMGSGTATAGGTVESPVVGLAGLSSWNGTLLLAMAVGSSAGGDPAARCRARPGPGARSRQTRRAGSGRSRRAPPRLDRLQRQLDHEPRPPDRGVLDPDRLRRGGARARPPGTARAPCRRSTPAARRGCPGRSARRGGGGRAGARPARGPPRRPGCSGPGASGSAGYRATTTRVTPPAYSAAFSTRLAITRSKRRLSTRRRRPSTPGSTSTGNTTGARWPSSPIGADAPTARRTSSPGSTSSSESSAEPASNREISSRSSTIRGEPLEVAVEEVEGAPGPRAQLVTVGLRAPRRWPTGWSGATGARGSRRR